MRNFVLLTALCFIISTSALSQIKTGCQWLPVKDYQNWPIEKVDSLNDHSLIKHCGQATWYRYRGGLYAASTKFKKGSVLRVTNPVNHKHVDVIVNDYGPNCRRRPKRIIDLDRIAFAKIANLSCGVIDIVITPLKIF